jgi:hypothetical protein
MCVSPRDLSSSILMGCLGCSSFPAYDSSLLGNTYIPFVLAAVAFDLLVLFFDSSALGLVLLRL